MSSIITPREHLGFDVGEARRLADWPKIVEYFRILDEGSDRIEVREVGKTTEGRPFLLCLISSPGNLANSARLRDIQARLADPRKIDSEVEAEALIAEGRAVVAVSCSIHATEVGATQMSMLLAHHLATSDDDRVRRVLDNVVLILMPCLNPDGLDLVKEWYDSTVGTPHEGVIPPRLYHKYAGHDNNRDWATFALAETRLTVEHCLNAWHPQIMYDLHQTRTQGMRMILPPYEDPIGPNVDPILQSELSMLGASMANDLTAQGKAGVAINVVYDGFSPSRSYLHYHGGVRVLSEVASVRIATPITLKPGQLRSIRREDPLKPSWNHPMPWQGGEWSLGDIVDYDFAAVMACLDTTARSRGNWVRNFYRVGKRAVSRTSPPFAYVAPPGQRDPKAASELLDVLDTAAVEIHAAASRFTADGRSYPPGSRVVLMAQPYGAFAKTVLESARYPDVRDYPGGPPKHPYDVTAHSLPLLMDVDVAEIRQPFEADLEPLEAPAMPSAPALHPANRPPAYVLAPESNAAARAVNRLLATGVDVRRASEGFSANGSAYAPGAFVVDGEAPHAMLAEMAERDLLSFEPVDCIPEAELLPLRPPRVGLYSSYVPNSEEGWTRLIFEQYGFAFRTLTDEDVRAGGLEDGFDAVVLPHQRFRQLHKGYNPATYPECYAGGLGDQGADSLRRFTDSGGTLVTWDGAARFAINRLRLPAKNSLSAYAPSTFFAPGSLLRVTMDFGHPLAYGMPRDAAVMFVNGPAFELVEGVAVARFPRYNALLSGWLLGHEKLHGRAALASVPLGKGRVVLMGYRPQFRAQARGTYKTLFNALYWSVSGA